MANEWFSMFPPDIVKKVKDKSLKAELTKTFSEFNAKQKEKVIADREWSGKGGSSNSWMIKVDDKNFNLIKKMPFWKEDKKNKEKTKSRIYLNKILNFNTYNLLI